MHELKVRVGENEEGKVTYIEPVNKAKGKTVESKVLLARLLTPEDEDREYKELMEEGRMYRRKGRRIVETR